ncbi:MAG: tetratricopeptide repeat protein [Nitrospirae bacterium]|nr:tetratricopeptide repeat protein [Nitrospirota bacterium]
MSQRPADLLFEKGLKTLKEGNVPSALSFFEKSVSLDENPINSSYLAYCIARERGQFKKAISMCNEAIKKEPENSVIYLNLARVYLLSDKRADAIEALRKGMSCEKNQEILNELNSLGIRKPPIFRFLNRANPVNKYLGVVLKRLGLR